MGEPLTPAELFVVRRVKEKLLSCMHHLGDAIEAAKTLPPEKHEQGGLTTPQAAVESKVLNLRALMRGYATKAEERNDG